MAVAPAALLLRPVPSFEQQPSVPSVSSASVVSSSSSHGSFSLFLHHRRPQSFRTSISRVTQGQEYRKQEEKAPFTPTKRSRKSPPPWQQKKASNVASNNKRFQNPPPWQKKSFDEALSADSNGSAHSFRSAPWQQGSRKHSSSPSHDIASFDVNTRRKFDSKPARSTDAEADKSAMAKIVEKLRTIQKTYDPVDSGQTTTNDFEESNRNGRRVTYDSREHASFHPSVSYKSRSRVGTKYRMMPGQSNQTTAGQSMSPHNARTQQKATGRAATEIPLTTINTEVSDHGNGSSMQAKILLSETESEAAKFPWERDETVKQEEKVTQKKARGPRIPSLAELTLSREELKRLRILGLQLPERLKIGKLGVTRSIIINIQQQFTTSELVKLRCEGEAAANIKKTSLEIEEKTGGLVVLRTGKIIVVYRGIGYNAEQSGMVNMLEGKMENLRAQENGVNIHAKIPLPHMLNHEGLVESHKGLESKYEAVINEGRTQDYTDSKVGLVANVANARWTSDLQAKREADLEAESILEGLGPRFENWAGLSPVPIDADLLPPVIPNYRPPFRLTPYGVRPSMSDAEVTDLRRRARPLGPHFVLGRNRGHHGLAAAMVKLWEKSEIAKITIRRRVQNTNNLIMANELKRLTGGILLSRDKFFITFYRGKDFVPEKVASALVEREASVRELQELEEKAREERSIPVMWTSATKPSTAVIGEEALVAKPSWVDTMDIKEQNRLKREVAKLQRMALAQKMEKKLLIALKKKEKAEQDLRKVEAFLKPIDRPIDVETITEEERFMFRKIALKMKAYLLIGRRGVFDGVVENMHLHWKHRELVKILLKEYDEKEVQETARMLEYESGGVLVAVTPTKNGQAIIMYRGKNYQRPMEIRPRNLLTKRKALRRSLELQRRESLSKNVKALEDQILTIRAELKKLSKEDDEGSQEGSNKGAESSHQVLPSIKSESDGLLSNEENEHSSEERTEPVLTKVMEARSMLIETEVDRNVLHDNIRKLERLVRSGPIYRADRLTNPERLRLRKEALSSGRAPQFFVGKNNGLEGLARGIRIHFLHHDLATIVVKGRSPGVSMEDLVHDLEELTGGVLVSQEANKIIMYRGWPEGEKMPSAESLDNLTPDLLRALEAEEDWEEDEIEDYSFEESEDSEIEHEDDPSGVRSFLLDSDDELGSEEVDGLDEGNEESLEWEDEYEEDDDQMVEYPILDSHLKLNGSAEEEEDDKRDEEDNDDQDSRWVLKGQLDDSAEEEEEDDEIGVEELDEEDIEEDEASDQDFDWDFEDSEDDTEDSDSVLLLESKEDIFVDGMNGKLTSEATEAW